jgi:hypothetical protein
MYTKLPLGATLKNSYRRNTYLLTPWSRVLPEKLKRPELLKKFPAFMEPEGS